MNCQISYLIIAANLMIITDSSKYIVLMFVSDTIPFMKISAEGFCWAYFPHTV